MATVSSWLSDQETAEIVTANALALSFFGEATNWYRNLMAWWFYSRYGDFAFP